MHEGDGASSSIRRLMEGDATGAACIIHKEMWLRHAPRIFHSRFIERAEARLKPHRVRAQVARISSPIVWRRDRKTGSQLATRDFLFK